ncbi:MAG: flagellar basal body-associated FliL family protein [Acidobacteriaceae bacterium]
MATPASPTFLKRTSVEPAETEETNGPEKNSPKKKAPFNSGALRWILAAAGVVVLVAGIAGVLYFVRHRAHRAVAGVSAWSSKNSSAAQPKKDAPPQVTIDLPLEPFVVNLADAGGRSYARIGLTLHLSIPAAAKKSESAESGENETAANELRDMARDQIIGVLNRQQSADLLAPDGKEHLKQAITAAIQARNPHVQVIDIYFTEFLVQS